MFSSSRDNQRCIDCHQQAHAQNFLVCISPYSTVRACLLLAAVHIYLQTGLDD